MPLAFNHSRNSIYCASSGAILFFGTDPNRPEMMVPCTIKRDALAVLTGADDIDPTTCVDVFNGHRTRVEAAASANYDAGRMSQHGRVFIEPADLQPRGEQPVFLDHEVLDPPRDYVPAQVSGLDAPSAEASALQAPSADSAFDAPPELIGMPHPCLAWETP